MTASEANSAVTAVLLIAHGSRREEANDDLRKLADLLRARHEHEIVQVSYLEIARPNIQEGGRICVREGATQVFMLPYFLSAGTHVVMDLEDSRTKLAAEFPEVVFRLCPHLGLHPLMVDIVLERLNEALTRPDSDQR